MIEYYNDILAIEVKWLAGDNKIKKGQVMKYDDYNNYRRAGKLQHLQNGGNGRKGLVSYESLPEQIKEQIIIKLGKSPYEMQKYRYFRKYIRDC